MNVLFPEQSVSYSLHLSVWELSLRQKHHGSTAILYYHGDPGSSLSQGSLFSCGWVSVIQLTWWQFMCYLYAYIYIYICIYIYALKKYLVDDWGMDKLVHD